MKRIVFSLVLVLSLSACDIFDKSKEEANEALEKGKILLDENKGKLNTVVETSQDLASDTKDTYESSKEAINAAQEAMDKLDAANKKIEEEAETVDKIME